MKKLFLFAADQKIEHLNTVDPEKFFKIASKAPIDALATQLGLIEKFGCDYRDVKYVAKLNSKTNLVPTDQKDPESALLSSVEDVLDVKKKMGLDIIGIGYTVYLGSEYEAKMLSQAAQVVRQAKRNGLLAILWVYPRGKSVKDERDPKLIAGSAGVAACLGADFVKVNRPVGDVALLQDVVSSAGRTKVVCSGGEVVDSKTFLKELKDQINIGRIHGCAIGRNIHEKPLVEAVTFCEEIAKIIGD